MTIKKTKKKVVSKKVQEDRKQKAIEKQELMLNTLYNWIAKPDQERIKNDDELDIEFFSSRVSGIPANYENTKYSGVNAILASDAMHNLDKNIPRFGTYNQFTELLKKHGNLPEKSDTFDPEKPLAGLKAVTPIYKWNVSYFENGSKVKDEDRIKQLNKLDHIALENNGVKKLQGMSYSGTVFAIEDIKHLLSQDFIDSDPSFKKAEELAARRMDKDKENMYFRQKTQNIINAMNVEIIEKEDSNRCYYSPDKDIIVLPPAHRFKNEESLLASTFHELSHASGHKDRLNRTFESKRNPDGTKNKKYEKAYAREEMIAETSTYFLCQNYGLNTFSAHANYIKHYADIVCENDNKKALISISSQAMKASNYISERVDAYELKLQQDLENKLSSNIKPENLVKNDSRLEQTFKTNNGKKFTVIVDMNDFENVKIVNEKNLNEYATNSVNSDELESFKTAIKKDLKDYTVINFEVNREQVKFDEVQRNLKIENTVELESKPDSKNRLKMA